MLTDRNVVCLSSIDWDFIWQGHQEIMASLARHGNRVLFVENTGVRAPALQDMPRLWQRLRNWRRGSYGFRRVEDNLVVYSPILLPFPYSRWARWINRALLLTMLRRWMRATRFERPLVWTFLPTPLAQDLIRGLDPELTVYYCIDDLASSSPAARQIAASEAQLFRVADLVFVTSEKLRERAAHFTDQVYVSPFGVNYSLFDAVHRQEAALPAELQALPRPLIGYVGGIHQWVDQELLATVVARLSEASFVLVGPIQTDVSRLAHFKNVHLLGARPHGDLPRYMAAFDVGLVPYRLTEYTAHVYPTKLNEYLAVGLPVVCTNLVEIRRFNAEHRDVVCVAHDTDSFVAAVRACLKGSAAAEVERRRAVARSNDWKVRIAGMSDLIEAALGRRRASSPRGAGRYADRLREERPV
jgi:glycosyltransferase involved in cell wall biosynthesis